MNTNAITITGSGKIVAVIDCKPYSIDTDHVNYFRLLEAAKNSDWNSFVSLADVTSKCADYIGDNGVEVKDGILYYKGYPTKNLISERIIKFMAGGLPFAPIVKFLENMMENPSKRAVDELYGFLEKGEMPITEDGCFLAYKNITSDFKDIHTRSIDNSLGAVVTMPRNQVCDDKQKTCSEGLHFCSISYLPSYSDSQGGKTVIVKINPKDVVSIPSDYDHAKGRCCAYQVVAEYTADWRGALGRNESGWGSQLYSCNGEDYHNFDGGDSDYADDTDDDQVGLED